MLWFFDFVATVVLRSTTHCGGGGAMAISIIAVSLTDLGNCVGEVEVGRSSMETVRGSLVLDSLAQRPPAVPQTAISALSWVPFLSITII
jgi:hypothetical protein